MDIQPIDLAFLFRVTVETAGPPTVLDTPTGRSLWIAVSGGTVEGPAMTGAVAAAGGDWGFVPVKHDRADPDVSEYDARLVLTDPQGHNVLMRYTGLGYKRADDDGSHSPGEAINPKSYYFRTTPRFITSAAPYQPLTRMVALATGVHRESAGPIYDVYEVR
jgi:hypothetical protein